MTNDNDSYKFGEPLPWKYAQATLARGGLGFWRIVLRADGSAILDPDDTLLTIVNAKRSDVPHALDKVLNKYFIPEGAETLTRVINDCISGKADSFMAEVTMLTEGDRQEVYVSVFGRIEQGNENGQDLIIVGCTQNLQELTVAKMKMIEALKESKLAAARTRTMIDGIPMPCDFWAIAEDNIHSDKASERSEATKSKPPKLTLLDTNKATLALFDMPDRESYILNFLKLSAEIQQNGRLSAEMMPEILDKALAAGSITFDWMHRKLDGTPIPCEVTFVIIPHDGGYGALSYIKDLRAIKAAQAELDEALVNEKATIKRTNAMLDALPLVCNFWDTNPCNINFAQTKIAIPGLQGKEAYLIDVSHSATTMFDFPDKKSYMDNFEKISPEFQPDGSSSREMINRLMNKAFCSGEPQIFEWMHQKVDGTQIPCEITLIRVSHGENYTLVGYMHDLRELKAAQSAMLMERLLLARIMESTPVFFTITVNDIIKFITPFAKEFSGCNIGDDISRIYTSSQEHLESKAKQEKGHLLSWHPVNIKRPDGTISPMVLNSFKADYYGEVGIMSWFIDMTEMHKKNTELSQARELAEESTKAKSNFLANMSHEIRTPMNAILGLLHLVLQSELSSTQHEYLAKTEGAAKVLLRIINDILDFSKIEAGKLEMENEVFYLDDVLQAVTDLASTTIHKKGLEYVVSVQPDTPTGLLGDQIRLVQILSNLVSNAVKFTEQGQILVKVETISKSPTEVSLRYLVQDTGIGLSEKQVKNLFSAFTQADASTTRRYGGTGLGLVICKHLVEMMNGTIWVESEYGKGSTFGFTATFGIHKGSLKHYFDSSNDFSGFTALVIDDNLVALDCLSSILESIGLTVKRATSGHEALSILNDWNKKDTSFDLVFVDWKMPKMDGIETAHRINQLISPAKLPVLIMVTAHKHDDLLPLQKKAGIKTILTKPVSPSTIVNMLGDIFGGIHHAKEQEIVGNKEQEQDMVKEFAGARILLAEDNEVNQLVASSILQNAGLQVDIANNGKEAVDMVQSGQYDLVLMDIQMPEMDGLEATRMLRSIPKFKDLPILAMTANAMSGDKEMSMASGMNDHISKPIDLDEMFSKLQKWLKEK